MRWWQRFSGVGRGAIDALCGVQGLIRYRLVGPLSIRQRGYGRAIRPHAVT
jgi:hypothetical protein